MFIWVSRHLRNWKITYSKISSRLIYIYIYIIRDCPRWGIQVKRLFRCGDDNRLGDMEVFFCRTRFCNLGFVGISGTTAVRNGAVAPQPWLFSQRIYLPNKRQKSDPKPLADSAFMPIQLIEERIAEILWIRTTCRVFWNSCGCHFSARREACRRGSLHVDQLSLLFGTAFNIHWDQHRLHADFCCGWVQKPTAGWRDSGCSCMFHLVQATSDTDQLNF